MSARPHLTVIDGHGEVVDETSHQLMNAHKTISRLEDLLARKQREIDELRHAKKKDLLTSDLSGDVLDVLRFHKRTVNGNRGGIVRGGPAFKAVLDRLQDTDMETGRPVFTKRHLQGASMGLWLVDSEDGWYRRHGKTGAAFLFANADRVQQFLAPVQRFRRETGVSALEIVDELGKPGLGQLAARCVCGRMFFEHAVAEHQEWGCKGFRESIDWQMVRVETEREREAIVEAA